MHIQIIYMRMFVKILASYVYEYVQTIDQTVYI